MSSAGLNLDEMLDVSWARFQFPWLETQVNGQTAAFLDGPAILSLRVMKRGHTAFAPSRPLATCSRPVPISRYRPGLMIWIIVTQELALKVYFDVPGDTFVTVPSD